MTTEINTTGDTIVEVMTIDATNADTLNFLSELGLLPLDGNTSSISMKSSKESLQEAGYTITEK